MDHLLPCDQCLHGAPLHETSGCLIPACSCRLTRTTIIEEALRFAAADIRKTWLPAPEA